MEITKDERQIKRERENTEGNRTTNISLFLRIFAAGVFSVQNLKKCSQEYYSV